MQMETLPAEMHQIFTTEANDMLDNMENDPNDYKDRIELEQVFEEERDESYPQTQRTNLKPGTAEPSKSNATSLNHSLAKKQR